MAAEEATAENGEKTVELTKCSSKHEEREEVRVNTATALQNNGERKKKRGGANTATVVGAARPPA